MAGTLITTSYPAGLLLTNANYTYVSIASTVVIGNASGIALYGAGTIDLTIANSGSVEATGTTTESYGIVLGGSGTITNTTGGLISGVYAGVLGDAVGTVVNRGSIAEQSTARGAGVVLVAGGGVTNDSVISGAEDGVHIEATGQVTNNGTITGGAGDGVIVSATGGIVNGTLSTIAGYRMGITLGDNGTVINLGTILSTQTSGNGAYYNTATQVLTLYNVGLWLNSGGIDNAAGAVISSNFFGAVISDGGSLDNQGSINGSSTTIGVGIFLFGGGTVSNAASGTITGGFEAIVAEGTNAGTVVNSGQIDGQGRAGVDLLRGGYLGNTGTILSPDTAVHINNGGTVHNAGSLGGGLFSVLVGQPATVDNLGVMTATAAGTGAVARLLEGGTISNEASGTIDGRWIGAQVYSTYGVAGTILNQGLILAADTLGDGAGAWIMGPGVISNAASGTISGGAFGIVGYSYADTVTNLGSIFATKYGVQMGGGTAVSALFNQGTITDDGTSNVKYALANAGVALLGPGTVSNSATGEITAYSVGVELKGGSSLLNDGTIISTQSLIVSSTISNQTLKGAGVRLTDGGFVGNSASGEINAKYIGAQIYSAGTGSAPGTIVNQGIIAAINGTGGVGAWMQGPGTISNAATGTISGGGTGIFTYGYADTIINQGAISGSLDAVRMGSGAANRVIVAPGATFSGTVDGGNALTATAASALELAAGAGVGSITGFGSKYIDFAQVTLDAGASWSLAGTVRASETISFDGDGVLTLANPGSVAGTITGFVAGDTLVLAGITDVTSAILGLGNLLTVDRSGGPSLALQFAPSQTFFGNNFPFTVTGGSTDLVAPACFAAGTRIATPAGEVLVETLRAGDHVVLARGGAAPVIWLGHRHVDCRAQGAPDLVQPVCIRAGALAAGLPARDLLLSPDHAIHVDGALIPVRHLINGRTVVQLSVDSVTYFHVELPHHEVILAERLPAESYLDTGNRAAFANAAEAPEHQARRDFSG